MRLKRFLIGLSALCIASLAVSAALAAVGAVPTGGDRQPSAADIRAAFSIFDRPRRAKDVIPARPRATRKARAALSALNSRFATTLAGPLESAPISVFVVDRGAELCLVFRRVLPPLGAQPRVADPLAHDKEPFAGEACGDKGSATSGPTPLILLLPGETQSVAVALMLDGVRSVDFTTAAGDVRTVPVTNNVAAIVEAGQLSSMTWTDPSGARHTEGLYVPLPPELRD